MKRTITIGDKYKALMNYYEMNYDKDEFNHLITKLLISYEKMKGKDIDIIMLTDLMENYDVNIFDFMSYISTCKKIENQKEDYSEIIVDTDSIKAKKREEVSIKTSNLIEGKKNISIKEKDNISLGISEENKINEKVQENKISEKVEESNSNKTILDTESSNTKSNNFAPILSLGIDLT